MTQPDSEMVSRVARLAIEYWRLLRAYDRVINASGPASSRDAAPARYAAGKLEAILAEADIRLATFEGLAFDPGLPVSAVNATEFDSEEGLFVASTVEPAVICAGAVLSMGRVVLEQRDMREDV